MIENKEIESPKAETRQEQAKTVDFKEEQMIQGAVMLEDPPGGSFMHALQTFINWVNDLVGVNSKPKDDSK